MAKTEQYREANPQEQSMSEVKYEDLKNFAQPLDLLVFQGKTFVEKWIIQAQKRQLNVGNWTHVGLVLPAQHMDFKNKEENELYIWESVISGRLSDGVPSTETGKAAFGIQIRKLRDVLTANQKSGSTIGILRLTNNPLRARDAAESESQFNGRITATMAIVNDVYDEYQGRGFDCNIFNCLAAVFPQFYWWSDASMKPKQEMAFFCSEFATMVYQKLGRIPRVVNPQLVSPQELISTTGDLAPIEYTELWEPTIYVIQPVVNESGEVGSTVGVSEATVHPSRKEYFAGDGQSKVRFGTFKIVNKKAEQPEEAQS